MDKVAGIQEFAALLTAQDPAGRLKSTTNVSFDDRIHRLAKPLNEQCGAPPFCCADGVIGLC